MRSGRALIPILIAFLGKQKPRDLFPSAGLCSGDVLLSHSLSPYYHRGCSVSLPGAEWERVGPPRYCHQRGELIVESHQRTTPQRSSLAIRVRNLKEQSAISCSLSVVPLIL